MNEMNLPKVGSIVGEIVKIDIVPEALRVQLNSDATVVTVQDFDGVNHAIWFADNQIAEFGLKGILFVGNVVSVNVEFRVEGETQYEDAAGNVEFHESTIIGATNAAHAAMITLRTKGLDSVFCDSLAKQRESHATATTGARTINFARQEVPGIDGLPTLIKEMEAKRDRSPVAYHEQYNKRIASLKKQLADAKPEKELAEDDAGGSAVKGGAKGKK